MRAAKDRPIAAIRLKIYEKMSEELSFENADGRTISGRFEVSKGMVTVTTSDGCAVLTLNSKDRDRAVKAVGIKLRQIGRLGDAAWPQSNGA